MSYFDGEFTEVTYDRGTDAIVATMDEYAEGEDFRAYMGSIIDAIEAEETDRIIADTSQIPPLEQDDQQWSVVDWALRAEASGLERMALVMPESVVSEISVENIVEMADDDITRDLFDNLDEAKGWTKRQ